VATKVLHDLGYPLYFGGDGELGKLVFVHPQQIIDLLKVIVQHNFEKKLVYGTIYKGPEVGGKQLFEEWKRALLSEGRLDHRILPQLWKSVEDPKVYHGLLGLLERFDLAYSVVDNVCQGTSQGDKCPSLLRYGVHGVPSWWPNKPLQSLAALWPLSGGAVFARKLYFDRLLPDGVFEQLLVRCLGLERLSLKNGKKALWSSAEVWGSGACFECEEGVSGFWLVQVFAPQYMHAVCCVNGKFLTHFCCR
jgi:hypothetical protein